MFAINAETLLGGALEPLERLAHIADATAAEVKRARKAMAEAREATRSAEALCDITAACRMHKKPLPVEFDDWEAIKDSLPGSRAHETALKANEGLSAFHFPVAFPEVFLRERSGFDVILGNPPWKEAKVEEDSFWSRHEPGFKALRLSDRDAVKARLKAERTDLVDLFEEETAKANRLRIALPNGPYPGMGIGDADLYKAFSWRFWDLIVRHGGWIGVLLPRSAFSVKGSSQFREEVFGHADPIDLTMLVNNRGWVFPEVHFQYSIGLAAIRRAAPTGQNLRLRGPFTALDRFLAGKQTQGSQFSGEEVAQWTDTAALPLLPNDESLPVFTTLRRAPRLDTDDGQSWRARPLSEELHSRKEQHLMREGEPHKGDWPVYKGESFDIWDSDTGSYYGWADPEEMLPHLQSKRLNGSRNKNSPFAEFRDRQGFLHDLRSLPCMAPRIALRRITRATDSRTMRAALIPPRVFLADQASCLLWPRGDEKDVAYMLGVLSSLPLDWYARRFVETDVRIHIINPLPIPRPSRQNAAWQRVVALAGRLGAPDKRFADWAEAVGVECGPLPEAKRQDYIHELDAVVAHLYTLEEKHLVHIFETFHEGWDYSERLHETLKHYRHWKGKAK
jgi:hypothetical protein